MHGLHATSRMLPGQDGTPGVPGLFSDRFDGGVTTVTVVLDAVLMNLSVINFANLLILWVILSKHTLFKENASLFLTKGKRYWHTMSTEHEHASTSCKGVACERVEERKIDCPGLQQPQ